MPLTTRRMILMCCALMAAVAAAQAQPYEPTWESLKKHEDPEWFRDAKFGIYTHWGPVTVGAEDGPNGVQWYGRSMYMPKNATFEYHREKYGDQNTVGYKDMIPKFTAKKFNAAKWAELFAASGAKFAGPAVIHHDNYAMWDSKYTRWDSMDQAPKRDFTAELAPEIRKRGMKFIATFHHAFAWSYFEPSYQYDAADGKNADLYCKPHQAGEKPDREYLDKWLGMVNEVVEKYQPELIWFDFGLGKLIDPVYQRRMFADYYNWAEQHGLQVGVAHKHWDIHEHTGIIDFERGRLDKSTEFPWLTDTSVGPWFHQKSHKYKSVNELVDVTVDIVSKNGCMLLNVGPAADGSIPSAAQELLRGLGAWMEINGEAIYATRPWLTCGEGPTQMKKSGRFSEQSELKYTHQDIRFTRSKDGKTVYAIVLGWPDSPVTIRSIEASGDGRVQLLGYDQPLKHRVDEGGQLVVDMPKKQFGLHAHALKLTGFEVSLSDEALIRTSDSIRVLPEKVTPAPVD